jgi:membrane-associated protein
VTLLGYWLGNVSIIRNNIEVFAIVVVIVSFNPIFFENRRAPRRSRAAAARGQTTADRAADVA